VVTVRNLGKYRLIAELGHGGMAEVFLSMVAGPLGSGFSKLAVVKRLRRNLVEEPEFIAMLVDEARISARLNHPNIVQTLEVDVDNGEYFIAMEFLDGQPLHRIQRRAARTGVTFTPEHQYVIVADVLAGLQHAHELPDYDGTALGIVHRDVTPQNIFVTYDGQVKVVDFGIAKAKGRASETRQGIVKGKVRYMSPEQALGKAVDARSDLFAVGVLLWEAAAGRHFWGERDELAIVQSLVAGEYNPSPRAAAPGVPAAIDAICRKALAYDPAERYASAAELRADLEAFLSDRVVHSRRTLGPLVAGLFAKERSDVRRVIERTSKESAEPMSIAAIPSGRWSPSTAPAEAGLVEPIAILSISPVMLSAPPPPVVAAAADDESDFAPASSRGSRFNEYGTLAAMVVAIVVAFGAVRTTGVDGIVRALGSLGGDDTAVSSSRAPAERVAMKTRLVLHSTSLRKPTVELSASPVSASARGAAPAAERVADVSPTAPDRVPQAASSEIAPPAAPTTRRRARPAIDTADPWSAAR
jgi:serine/threonine-protein kinase